MRPLQAAVLKLMEWTGIVWSDTHLVRVSLGHPSRAAVLEALKPLNFTVRQAAKVPYSLVPRLRAYLAGKVDDFLDVPVWPVSGGSDFNRRVLEACRKIPFGQVMTYGELGQAAMGPAGRRAARAVGQCMAGNPTPLVVPCHRVIRSDGQIGHYSAVGGTKTKCRLLELEGHSIEGERLLQV